MGWRKKSPAQNVEANKLCYKNVLDALFPYFQKRESVKWILGNQCTNANNHLKIIWESIIMLRSNFLFVFVFGNV